jgi:hypothetical protein
MRTQEEIIERIKEVEEGDFFGFEVDGLIEFITFENAQEVCRPEITEEEWNLTLKASGASAILDYLLFAWDKANSCRGLSAARSLSYMKAWLWIEGDDDVSWLGDYEYYGKPHLVKISERFGFDWKERDNGPWCGHPDGPYFSAEDVLK